MINSSIKIISLNANRSPAPTENALEIAVEHQTDIILIQEPWFHEKELEDWSKEASTAHPGFTQILPNTVKDQRPRTIAYISRNFAPSVSLASSSPPDGDMQILEVNDSGGLIHIINIYNQIGQGTDIRRTFQRSLEHTQLHQSTVIAGDFNSHHPWWNPRIKTPSTDAELIVDWFEEHNLQLLNRPGQMTYHRQNTTPSVLDLVLITESVSRRAYNFALNEDLVSDHVGFMLDIQGRVEDLVDNPLQQSRYNTSKADWDLFHRKVKQFGQDPHIQYLIDGTDPILQDVRAKQIISEENSSETTDALDKLAQALTDVITKAADIAIPRVTKNAKSKAWWTTELKQLRTEMASKRRHILIGDSNSTIPYLKARNEYFMAVKKAKTDHWNKFLEKEDAKSIFRAMKYTNSTRVQRMPSIKDQSQTPQTTFEGKCRAFRTALFPPPPEAERPSWDSYQSLNKWEWPTLAQAELQHACSSKIQSKSPGPDTITQDIITHAYEAIPELFFQIYSKMINTGYHPAVWRQATGAILPKPGKPDYSIPKAYRIITLLNCLGKVSERIMAQRLNYLAETTDLLHDSQIGGRLKKSAIDAALLLKNEVEINKNAKLKTSTVFMDVKGAYDHVAKHRLLQIFQQLGLPLNLISWVSTFLSQRQLRLAFDGQIQDFAPNRSGVPQGSPISPILFLIYIRDLFKSTSIKWISYADDISITAANKSIKQNVKTLQREAAKLIQLSKDCNIAFDLEKTELLHWEWNKTSRKETLTLPNGDVLQPLPLVKWLGIYFDANLNFKHHISVKIAKARNAFFRMARLASIEKGLTPFALRQLYIACVTSIADYGAIIWWNNQLNFVQQLQSLQTLAMRKILGVFKTAPILPMEVECALPPPDVRIASSIRDYAFRLHKLAPTHPVNKAIHRMLNPQEEVQAGKITPQLQRIYESINQLTEGLEIEPIRHYHFPPWRRGMPYKVEISQLSKEDEAIQHTTTFRSNPHNHVFIYTDASSTATKDSKGIGVGMTVLSPPSETIHHESLTNIGPNNLVYNGELEGATLAAEYAAKIAKPRLHFHVYSDNQAGLWRLKTPSDNPGQSNQIRAIEATQRIIQKGGELTYHWVPGHTNVQGNERADTLAKAATFERPTSHQTSYAMLGLRMKQQRIREWKHSIEVRSAKSKTSNYHYSYRKRFEWKLQSKMLVPMGTQRKTASAFYQLKLGHGQFRSYLYQRGHVEDDMCYCGAKETPEHLLLVCPMYTGARCKLKDHLKENKPTLQQLLTTARGIEATLEFLNTTEIATRKWHLARENWGNEEEEE